MSKIGNGGKGIAWNTEDEETLLNALNTTVREEGVSKGLQKIEKDIYFPYEI
jgi:nitrate reductase alpha subunit